MRYMDKRCCISRTQEPFSPDSTASSSPAHSTSEADHDHGQNHRSTRCHCSASIRAYQPAVDRPMIGHAHVGCCPWQARQTCFRRISSSTAGTGWTPFCCCCCSHDNRGRASCSSSHHGNAVAENLFHEAVRDDRTVAAAGGGHRPRHHLRNPTAFFGTASSLSSYPSSHSLSQGIPDYCVHASSWIASACAPSRMICFASAMGSANSSARLVRYRICVDAIFERLGCDVGSADAASRHPCRNKCVYDQSLRLFDSPNLRTRYAAAACSRVHGPFPTVDSLFHASAAYLRRPFQEMQFAELSLEISLQLGSVYPTDTVPVAGIASARPGTKVVESPATAQSPWAAKPGLTGLRMGFLWAAKCGNNPKLGR